MVALESWSEVFPRAPHSIGPGRLIRGVPKSSILCVDFMVRIGACPLHDCIISMPIYTLSTCATHCTVRTDLMYLGPFVGDDLPQSSIFSPASHRRVTQVTSAANLAGDKSTV